MLRKLPDRLDDGVAFAEQFAFTAESTDPTASHHALMPEISNPLRPHVTAAVAAPPTALADVDRTSGGIATGNILTGANTLSGALGKDYGGSGPYVVAANTYHLAHGDLILAANGSYTYERTTPIASLPVGTVDTFSYDFIDAKGVASNFTTLSIALDPAITPILNTKTGEQSGSDFDESFSVTFGAALGRGGDDILKDTGAHGATLDGGAGNDVLLGGSATDILIGGAGSDSLTGGSGTAIASYENATARVIVDLLHGNGTLGDADGDTLTNIFGIIGGKGGDTLIGDGNTNLLSGNAGNDVLAGGGGDDRLDGAAGADTFDGGSGTDTVLYLNSKSAIVLDLDAPSKSAGDAKGDTFSSIEQILGSTYADTIIGDANDNNLQGVYGNDKLYGGGGDDHLEGQFDHNLLHGGDGDDALYTGFTAGGPTIPLSDGTAYGESGDDSLHGWNGNDVLDGGDGSDTFSGDAGDDTETGDAGNDVMHGDDGNDKLDGGADADSLFGEVGDDVLTGGAGNDLLAGGDNDDVLIGGVGADALVGGNGFDIASYETATSNVIAGLLAGGAGGDATGDTYNGIEGLKGGSGDDFLAGDANDNKLYGGAGNDFMAGNDGNDVIHGGAGADHMDGGKDYDAVDYYDSTVAITLDLSNPLHNTGDAKGDTFASIEEFGGTRFNDTMIGGTDAVFFSAADGNDKVDGGVGNDTLFGGSGSDQINGNGGDDVVDGDDGVDIVLGGSGDDTVQGDTGNDKLDGGSGDDVLNGGDDNDTLTGGDGNDTLEGDFGDDKLDGGAGNDLLYGQEGNDTMTGGAGSDTFLLIDKQTGKDKITDFNPGEDTLHINAVLNGPGDDIQDLIDAGVTVTTTGHNLTIGWNGGADGATISNWIGGPVNDVQTLGLILGSHLEVSH